MCDTVSGRGAWPPLRQSDAAYVFTSLRLQLTALDAPQRPDRSDLVNGIFQNPLAALMTRVRPTHGRPNILKHIIHNSQTPHNPNCKPDAVL